MYAFDAKIVGQTTLFPCTMVSTNVVFPAPLLLTVFITPLWLLSTIGWCFTACHTVVLSVDLSVSLSVFLHDVTLLFLCLPLKSEFVQHWKTFLKYFFPFRGNSRATERLHCIFHVHLTGLMRLSSVVPLQRCDSLSVGVPAMPSCPDSLYTLIARYASVGYWRRSVSPLSVRDHISETKQDNSIVNLPRSWVILLREWQNDQSQLYSASLGGVHIILEL